jgi:hypothetical protein
MKELNMFSGRKYLVQDEEAETIAEHWHNGAKKPIRLRTGADINLSGIESIDEVELDPFFLDNPMNKAMTKVLVQGEWRAFAGKRAEVEFKINVDKYTNADKFEESVLLQIVRPEQRLLS